MRAVTNAWLTTRTVESSYSQILERMSECENHYGLTFTIRLRQQIQFALRVEASDLVVTREIFLPQDDRFTEENRHVARVPFGRLVLFPTRHVLLT